MAGDRWSVARWMSKTVHTMAPGDPLVTACELMREHRMRHIPVVDGTRVVGIISDRDVRGVLPTMSELRTEPVPCGLRLLALKAADVMTRLPLSVTPDTSIREAAQTICREKIGALPVLQDGQLIGIVSADDLLWGFSENLKEAEYVGMEDEDRW